MPRILVVDDEPTIRKAVEQALSREGYTIETAESGEEALQRFSRQQPDLLVLDVMLPDLSGLEVCRQVRERSPVPVLLLTARGEEVDKVIGFNSGADDYLTKPFSLAELSLRVKAILRRTAARSLMETGQVNQVRVGSLSIDKSAHRVTIDGTAGPREIELAPKEFELLWLFATHPQQVFTREHLLQRVWHSDYKGDEASVTVCIRRLREKIEPDPGEPAYIKTVWGVGYKFNS